MMGILRMEFARAFVNKRFLVVFLLALACFAYGYYDAGHFFPGLGSDKAGNVIQNTYELWLFVHFRSFFAYFAPIAAALPFVDSLWMDRNHGFLRFILARSAYHRYLAAKLLANLAAGALAVAGPLLLLFGYFSLSASRALPTNSLIFNIWGAQNGSPAGILSSLYTTNPGLYILALIGLAALFGAAYATLGLAISGLVNNRYIVLAAPFIAYIVSAYIADRARHLGAQWSPETILIPYNTAAVSAFTIFIQLAALGLLSGLFLLLFARRSQIVS